MEGVSMCEPASNISDDRKKDAFKGVSFSGYKKSQVLKALMTSLKEGSVEPATYWSAEMVCAGQLGELWEALTGFAAKHIHTANPLVFPYMERKLEGLRDMLRSGFLGNEIQLRNHAPARRLLAEVVGILAFSRKAHSVESVKVKRQEEFDVTHMSTRLRAPDLSHAAGLMKRGDAQELTIPINELAYHVSAASKNAMQSCYWIEWIFEFDAACRKKKAPCVCQSRPYGSVEGKHAQDPAWLIWEALLAEESRRRRPQVMKIVEGARALFASRYTAGVKRKRRYLLYFVVSLLTGHVDITQSLCDRRGELEAIVSKVDGVYKQVRKNEHAAPEDPMAKTLGLLGPGGGGGRAQTSVEKTAAKLSIMNQLGFMGTEHT